MMRYESNSPVQLTYLETKEGPAVRITQKRERGIRIPLIPVLLSIVVFFTASIEITKSAAAQDAGSISQESQPAQEKVNSPFINGCVFPDSSQRLLTEDDLSHLSCIQGYSKTALVQYAINEIYARNHYSFQNAEIRSFYESCSWYADYGYTAQEAVNCFNEYERINVNKLCNLREQFKSGG